MADKEYPEEGELVLCTVEKILGTTVFVRLGSYNRVGVVATSEISPGRIRNIRDYVTINKKIVCKVLRIDKERGHIDLSLRRVSLKDKKEILEGYKKEKNAIAILERIIEKSELQSIIDKINKDFSSIFEFLGQAKENPKILEKIFTKKQIEQLTTLIKERIKSKKIVIKAKMTISCDAPNGISIIKKVLAKSDGISISYISAPQYIISITSEDYKEANKKLNEEIEKIIQNIKKAGGKAEIIK